MIPQNKIFLNRDSQQNLTVYIIKSYISATFFKTVAQFEARTHTNAPYIGFQLSNLPILEVNSASETCSTQLLVAGINKGVKITAQLIRTIHFGQTVLCLALDNYQQSQKRFFPIAIIFKNSKEAEEWCNRIQYLCLIRVYYPFVSFDSFYKSIFLIVRYEWVESFESQLVSIKLWHNAKILANDSFKRREYKLALVLYQLALGLLWQSQKSRDRAILYSNAAQSFFELSLSENTLLYADTAIVLDRTFVKSYYRKLCSLLDLQQFEKIPQILMLMANACSKEEFTTAHERYTRYMANKTGIFNWFQILIKKSSVFGNYLNSKLITRPQKQQGNLSGRFFARSLIPKYQLIAVQRTAIYADEKSGSKNNRLMHNFFEDIYQFLELEKRFSERIKKMLENQKKRIGSEQEISRAQASEAIFHSYRFKSLYIDESNIALCPEYTLFQKDESPNCSFLCLSGGFFYFAIQDIQQHEALSIELFNQTIESPHDSMRIFSGKNNKKGMDIYDNQKGYILQNKMYKTAIRYLWKMLKDTTENRGRVILELVEIMELYPLWEIVILVLCQLQSDHSFPSRERCKRSILNIFEKCFKLGDDLALFIVNHIISD